MTTTQAFAELMQQYNTRRAHWEQELGDKFNEAEFNAWFTN